MGMLGREEGTTPNKARDACGWGPEARFRSLGLKTGPAANQCATLGQWLTFWGPQFPPLSSGDRGRVAFLTELWGRKEARRGGCLAQTSRRWPWLRRKRLDSKGQWWTAEGNGAGLSGVAVLFLLVILRPAGPCRSRQCDLGSLTSGVRIPVPRVWDNSGSSAQLF